MTAIEIYAFFGPPAIGIAVGLAALWLDGRAHRRLSRRDDPGTAS